MSKNGHKRLRLVKLVIQPHFVLDDGESLTEHVAEPLTVKASEREQFNERFPELMRDLEKQLTEQ